MRVVLGLVVAILSIGACNAQPAASLATAGSSGLSTSGPSVAIPSTQSSGASPAEVACSDIIDNIPMVAMNSGEATLAAAYEVTSGQLADFLERIGEQNGVGGSLLQLRDDPNKIVDVCTFDGDFTTKTPGPPGHNNTAVRVLVAIADGQAQLWAMAIKDRSVLPTTDPAKLDQDSSPSQ